MLIIDGIIYSLQSHGGISVYFNELLRRMRSRRPDDYKMVIYGNAAANLDFLLPSIEIRPTRILERYRRCPVPAQTRLFHSSYYRLPDRCIPVVTTVHDFIYERFTAPPRKWLHSWQKFAAIQESQAVICISESTRRDLLHFLPHIPPTRLHVVHNGVSDVFHPLASIVAQASLGRPYILFVGARGGYKNFTPLVHALAGLKDFCLVCVGGGRLTPREATLVQKQLGERFLHHMRVSDAELNMLYNGAFCLAYPSAYEGFGIPILEAMRAGCPVISINSSSIPEVAGEAALLLPEASPEGLKGAISQMEKAGIREHYRQLGLERASLFSWDRTYAETSKIYSALLAK